MQVRFLKANSLAIATQKLHPDDSCFAYPDNNISYFYETINNNIRNSYEFCIRLSESSPSITIVRGG